MNKYYVYAHIRPDTKEIFYIGKGTAKRKDEKIKRNEYWKRIVNKHGVEVVVLFDNLTETEAYEKEHQLVTDYKKQGLCCANITMGGDGINIPHRWWGDKISKAMVGKNKRRGLESCSYKDLVSREQLLQWYKMEHKNIIEISKLCGLSTTTITDRLRRFEIPVRKSGRGRIKIKCLEDGLVFDSINDAAKHYGLFRENIRKVLRGHYKQTGKLTFKKI